MTTNFTITNNGPKDISVEIAQDKVDTSPQIWCFTIVKPGQAYGRSVYDDQEIVIKEVSDE